MITTSRRSVFVNGRATRWFGGGDANDWLESGSPASMGDQPGGWGNTTPNANLGGFHRLVQRMRDLESFVPALKGSIDVYADEVLGKTGVLPNFDRWPGLQEVFSWWMHECDFGQDQNLDLIGKEEQAVRVLRRDGNIIVRHIHQMDMSRVPMSRVPYQFQLLQIDHLPSWYNMPLASGGYIHGGMQFSKSGKLEGYWMFPVHPTDFQVQFNTRKFPMPIWVDAAEISVVRDIGEPGSVRTTPPMRTGATPMRESYEFMDAESVRMRNNANTGIIVSAPGYSDDDENFEGMYGAPDGGYGAGRGGPNAGVPFDVDPMEPGGLVKIPPGWKAEQTKPGEVGASFEPFLRRTWGAAAIGTGTPYGRFADDYAAYSSDRIAKIADRDFDVRITRWRHNMIVRQFLRPIIKRFAIAAYLSGQWKPERGTDMREVYTCPIQSSPREDVHRLQGEQAAELAIRTGLESRDDLAAKRGKKAAQIDFENAVAQERKRLLGTVVLKTNGEMTSYPPPPDTPIGRRITQIATEIIEREAYTFEGSTRVATEQDPAKQVAEEPKLGNTFDEDAVGTADGLYIHGPLGAVVPG
jgi:capsid protein